MPVTAEASRVGAQAQGATESSLKALDSTGVRLERVCVAREMTSKVGPRSFLHAGPPISLADIPGPMRGAIIGGLLLSQLLTLYTTPVIYLYMERLRVRLSPVPARAPRATSGAPAAGERP